MLLSYWCVFFCIRAYGCHHVKMWLVVKVKSLLLLEVQSFDMWYCCFYTLHCTVRVQFIKKTPVENKTTPFCCCCCCCWSWWWCCDYIGSDIGKLMIILQPLSLCASAMPRPGWSRPSVAWAWSMTCARYPRRPPWPRCPLLRAWGRWLRQIFFGCWDATKLQVELQKIIDTYMTLFLVGAYEMNASFLAEVCTLWFLMTSMSLAVTWIIVARIAHRLLLGGVSARGIWIWTTKALLICRHVKVHIHITDMYIDIHIHIYPRMDWQ